MRSGQGIIMRDSCCSVYAIRRSQTDFSSQLLPKFSFAGERKRKVCLLESIHNFIVSKVDQLEIRQKQQHIR